MAKRVKLGLDRLRVNETECRLLGYIIDRARDENLVGCEYVALSRREMAQAVGCSALTTVRSCQYLERVGLIDARVEHSESGAQIANSYKATALGLEVSRLYRESLA